jgi:hypothetical protein
LLPWKKGNRALKSQRFNILLSLFN